MKILKSFIVGGALALSLTACNDWLDINVDPNSPTAESVEYHMLLPWCQFYMSHDYLNTGSNAAMYTGHILRMSNAREKGAALWDLGVSTRRANTYQWFFVGVGPNLDNLYQKAMADQAFHYAGAAKLIKAYGFMLMTDIFGEIPYTEAFGSAISPKFDTGKTVFLGALGEIDEAIELFQKDQPVTATPLAQGDSWNGGDKAKWLKFAYLLKARWLNHLSKKEAGSYKDGKYDEQEILRCLDLAMQSNSDNTVIRHTDTNGNTHDVLGWNETVDYNTMFSCVGMNSNFYVTKTYYDNLTNFMGLGVEDPRADRFIPWARSQKSASTPADIKWSADGKWRRSAPVDIVNTNITANSGPYAVSWNKEKGFWFCDTELAERQGDTIYVQTRSSSKGYHNNVDLLWRAENGNDASAMSSIFQVRPDTPTYLGSYWEACFIKAEVLAKKGDNGGAVEALKKAVKAHMEAVNEQLNKWISGDASLKNCPSFVPMNQADIDNYVDNVIAQAAAQNLMGTIMTQKLISEEFMVETWNDFRRHDFNPEVFLEWNKSYEYRTNPNYLTYCPEGKGPRRWAPAAIEQDYNKINLTAVGELVPGANDLPLNGKKPVWYESKEIATLNIWWDSTQQ